MSNCKIAFYEISEFQHAAMTVAANSKVNVFVTIYPNEKDDAEAVVKLNKYLQETQDLLTLGLIEDVSADFESCIKTTLDNENRQSRVYTPTVEGFLLFKDFGKRPIQ